MNISSEQRPESVVPLPGVAETECLARAFADVVRSGDVFALRGALGAGKTTFARAFIHALADRNGVPRDEVPSPTFTLVQEYAFASVRVCHFDLYRIEDAAETIELGIEDAFVDAISLIEWPERLGALLPADRVDLTFRFVPGEDARECALSGHGGWRGRVEELLGHG